MCFFLLIFAIILLLGLIPFGVVLEYSEDGFSYTPKISFLKINLPDRKKAGIEREQKEKKPGGIGNYKKIIHPAVKALGKLVRTVRIKKLVADIRIATSDSFSTAMLYGGCASAFGLLFPIAANNLRIKKKYITVNADFEEAETKLYFFCEISVNIWQLLYIASYFMFKYLKEKRKDLL